MAVQDPGTLTVFCDHCDKDMEMDTTEYAGDPSTWGIDDSTLEENGWDRTADGILCPDCLAEQEEEESD